MKPLAYVLAPIALVSYATAPCVATDFMTVEEAQKSAFSDAAQFTVAHVLFTGEQKHKIEELSGVPVLVKAQKIWCVTDSTGKNLGWFVVDYVIGKHLLIDYAVAIDASGAVKNIDILSYRESYGSEIRSEDWRKQFYGKTKESELQLNGDITNIGGATLSARHVTEGVKRILATIHVTQQPT